MEWDVFLLASKGTDWTRSQFGGCAKWHQQEGEGRVLCVCVSRSVASDSLWLHGLEPAKLLCPWSSPGKILEWVGFLFSRGSSQPRDGTQCSCIVGNFLTRWTTREAWVGLCWPKNKTTKTLSISAHKKNFYRRRRRKKKGKTGDIKIKKLKSQMDCVKPIWGVQHLWLTGATWLWFPLKSRCVWKEGRTRAEWRGAWASQFPSKSGFWYLELPPLWVLSA